MNEAEINKTIAEFMGLDFEEENYYTKLDYTKSLDALVPVWEKLNINHDVVLGLTKFAGYTKIVKYNDNFIPINTVAHEVDNNKNIQLAAAKATALAIKELG